MKPLIFLFVFVSQILVCGQSITAPTPLTVEANAAGVDDGNFARIGLTIGIKF